MSLRPIFVLFAVMIIIMMSDNIAYLPRPVNRRRVLDVHRLFSQYLLLLLLLLLLMMMMFCVLKDISDRRR